MKSNTIVTIELIISITLALYLSSLDNLLISNFSVIGNDGGHHLIFISWGIVTNIYFFTVLYKYLKSDSLLILSFVSGLGAVLLPYLPTNHYIVANLHIILGFTCFGTYTYNVAKILMLAEFCDYSFSKRLRNAFQSTLVIMGLIMAWCMQVNTLIEIIYCVSVSLLLYFIYLNINVKI